jgi:hypothetical protein
VRLRKANEAGGVEDANVVADRPLLRAEGPRQLLDAGRAFEQTAEDPPPGRVAERLELIRP